MMLEPWYRSPEFLAAIATLIVIVLLLVHVLRRKQVASRIDSALDERPARDPNDPFLQTAEPGGLLADHSLSKYHGLADLRQALEKLSEWLGPATEESESALDSLRRSTNLRNESAEAFHPVIEMRAAPGLMEITFSQVGEAKEMHPMLRGEINRIGHEAIRNAYMHSKATHLNVDLVSDRDFSLRVVDNGCGIDFAALGHKDSPMSGLTRMRKQAARIGGKLTVSSSAGVGTEVHLQVPRSGIWRRGFRFFGRSAKSRHDHRNRKP